MRHFFFSDISFIKFKGPKFDVDANVKGEIEIDAKVKAPNVKGDTDIEVDADAKLKEPKSKESKVKEPKVKKPKTKELKVKEDVDGKSKGIHVPIFFKSKAKVDADAKRKSGKVKGDMDIDVKEKLLK